MEKTLSRLCTYLNNWFDRDLEKVYGTIHIENNAITDEAFLDNIQNGQYFKIYGSVFNDGVHKYVSGESLNLHDEVFVGSIWLMAIPQEVLDIATDIEAWAAQYEALDGPNMSPYTSESFGGYSYTKASSNSATGGTSITWQDAFASRLSPWRKKK